MVDDTAAGVQYFHPSVFGRGRRDGSTEPGHPRGQVQ